MFEIYPHLKEGTDCVEPLNSVLSELKVRVVFIVEVGTV